MQLKKNPKADLAKSSGLFFAIGFAIVSGLSLWAFEAKVYDKSVQDTRTSDFDKPLDEDQEQFVMENPDMPPPPPPPPAPVEVPAVEVVDNDTKIKETDIATTETQKETKVVDVGTISTPEPVEEPVIDVPFTIIEDKPMFQACKDQPKEKQFDCFKKNLDKHVADNFTYPPTALEMGIQGRVNVSFRINTDGSITVIGVRGTDKLLEAEARRIIEKLPKLIPGKQRGKATPVTFAYPINFKINN